MPTGRPTSRRRSPTWSAAHEAAGTTYDLVLLGNDAADTGDFQVGIRLSYLLDRPVVAGVSTLSASTATGRPPAAAAPDGGTEIFEVPLPAVLTVMEGGVEPRYPSIPGRMKAKKVAIEEVAPTATAGRTRAGAAQAAAGAAEPGRGARRGTRGRRRRRRPAGEAGGACDERVLVLVETDAGGATEVSRETLTFARGLGARACTRWSSATARPASSTSSGRTASPSCTTPTVTRSRPTPPPPGPPPSWPRAGDATRGDGGRHAARQRGARPRRLPARRGDGRQRRRGRLGRPARRVPPGARRCRRWRRCALDDAVAVLSVAGHACDPAEAETATTPVVHPLDVAVVRRRPAGPRGPHRAGGARRVRRPEVRPGRGRRRPRRRRRRTGSRTCSSSPSCSTASLGVSRVVTSLGWRPHHEQVGQTGSRVVARPLRRLRHQRRDPALGRHVELEDDPGDQHRRRRPDGDQGALRGDRRPARDRARRSTRSSAAGPGDRAVPGGRARPRVIEPAPGDRACRDPGRLSACPDASTCSRCPPAVLAAAVTVLYLYLVATEGGRPSLVGGVRPRGRVCGTAYARPAERAATAGSPSVVSAVGLLGLGLPRAAHDRAAAAARRGAVRRGGAARTPGEGLAGHRLSRAASGSTARHR